MKKTMCVLGAIVASTAGAQLITPGLYSLNNHPDGSAAPPLYGFRLDGLFPNPGGGKSIYTFDFDNAQSSMMLDYDGSSIRIFGEAFGGRDTGGNYALDATLGVYAIDFTYSVGLGFAANDDDLLVSANKQDDGQNTGTITAPDGTVISLWDESNGSFTFRFGDEQNDNGHRGFDGISGWGWVNHTVDQHVVASDWLFTATRVIPTPATAALGLLGAGLAAGRRRS